MKNLLNIFWSPSFGLIFAIFWMNSCLVQQIGGAFSQEPEALKTELSEGAKMLLKAAYVGISQEKLRDHHVHLLGLGTQNTGAFIHPQMQSWQNPFQQLKLKIYTSAAGIENLENADQEYVSRLVRLARNIEGHGKYHLLAFDKFYEPDGTANLDKTQFYIPNEYVFRLAQEYPDIFLPTISVHPYRNDAIQELEKWAKQGVKFVKWLPNAMGIDPSHEKNHGFYQKMKDYQMILLSHAGKEEAVEAATPQFGNPLLLRTPLDLGLRVIVAHSASLGDCENLKNPVEQVPCFDLFLQMMAEPQYEKLLFGEISAVTQTNRPVEYLKVLIQRQELHPRLVNGSDYPLPAVNFIIRTKDFVKQGMLSKEEGKFLNEIYHFNPLLYDFVLKRTLKIPSTSLRFSPSIFMGNPLLD